MNLEDFQAQHPYLICIDSDGCALDTMEAKHRLAFIPNTIKHWGLEPIQQYAWQAALFAHLYSQLRGVVRYTIFIRIMELLQIQIERNALDFVLPDITAVKAFVADDRYETSLPGLLQYQQDYPAPELETAVQWVRAIDHDVLHEVKDVAVFPFVRESLEFLQGKADVVVISVTPTAQLTHEWASHNLLHLVNLITGQEAGAKSVRIRQLMRDQYQPQQVLMMGDSPGDWRAAQHNGVPFYPILAGHEAASWAQFYDEDLHRFLAGDYVEQALVEKFNANLPEDPDWL